MTTTGTAAPVSAADLDRRRWKDRRLASWSIRATARLLPLAAAVAATRLFVTLIDRPAVALAAAVYWLGAVVLSVGVAIGVDRWSRRLLPLADALRIPLVFPDRAPNRLRVAFAADDTERLGAATRSGALSPEGAAARNLLSLVGLLRRYDRATRGHAERVSAYAALVGAEMELDEDDLAKLRWGALIHDVGKLSIPMEILAKETALDEDEWQIVRNHPVAATAYLGVISGWLGPWSLAALEHHERWDGDGYPGGLYGREISLAGRIVALVDAYDLMTSPRSYQPASSPSAAREELARAGGTQFDPAVVRAFLQVPRAQLRSVLGLRGWLNELAWITRVPRSAATAAFTATTAATLGVAMIATGPASTNASESAAVERSVATEASEPTADDGAAANEQPAADPTSTTTTTTAAPRSSTTTTPTTTAAPTTTESPTDPIPPPPAGEESAVVAAVFRPPSEPTGTGFVTVDPTTLPLHLGDGQLSSDDHGFIWFEGAATTEDEIELRPFVDGVVFEGEHDHTVVVPLGTTVCTYLLHIDPRNQVPTIEVGLDFGVAPLGFALTGGDLDLTNRFGVADVDLRSDGFGVADLGLVAGTTITFWSDVSIWGRDQVRIFFAC